MSAGEEKTPYLVLILTSHNAVDVCSLVKGETESWEVGGQEHRDCAYEDRRGGQAKLLLLLCSLLDRGVRGLQ